jgi:hypothetical protein
MEYGILPPTGSSASGGKCKTPRHSVSIVHCGNGEHSILSLSTIVVLLPASGPPSSS